MRLERQSARPRCDRRIGGITGDVLGPMSQLATTGALLVIACSP